MDTRADQQLQHGFDAWLPNCVNRFAKLHDFGDGLGNRQTVAAMEPKREDKTSASLSRRAVDDNGFVGTLCSRERCHNRGKGVAVSEPNMRDKAWLFAKRLAEQIEQRSTVKAELVIVQ
jgi:hypothetical protein